MQTCQGKQNVPKTKIRNEGEEATTDTTEIAIQRTAMNDYTPTNWKI